MTYSFKKVNSPSLGTRHIFYFLFCEVTHTSDNPFLTFYDKVISSLTTSTRFLYKDSRTISLHNFMCRIINYIINFLKIFKTMMI